MTDTAAATGAEQSGSAGQTTGATGSQTDGAAGAGAGAAAGAGKPGKAAAAGAGASADAGAGAGAGDAGAGANQSQAAWYEGLPDDLKGQAQVTRHANVEDAVRALVGAEKRLGVPADQLMRKPTKPEEYADVYKALGAPEKAEDYKIGLPDKATDADKALATKFGQAMFEKGPFPPDFVKAAVEFINGETLAGDEALATAQAESKAQGEAMLKKELGQAYDPDMKAVGKLLNDLGGEELAAEFDAVKSGDNPRLMLALTKIVDRLGESGKIDGGNSGTGAAGGITPDQAKAARLNLENDPVKGPALMDNSHSMHKSVLEERTRLLRLEEGLDPNS